MKISVQFFCGGQVLLSGIIPVQYGIDQTDIKIGLYQSIEVV